MLLCVTFGFLILTTPGKVLVFCMNYYDGNTPQYFAGLNLFYQIGEKTFYTNHGVNFFLYVVSGQKFRQELVNLFKFKKPNSSEGTTSNSTVTAMTCANNVS